MQRKLHHLSALLILPHLGKPRMEADPKPDDKPASGGSGKREMTAEQWEQQRRAELDKENSKELLNRVVQLEKDNFDLRRKAAPEGSLILSAEERKRWEAWVSIHDPNGSGRSLTPQEVQALLDQGKKDREVVKKQERRAELDKVAQAAAFDSDTFAELDSLAGGLEYRVQSVKDKESGEDIQQAQVKQGDTWTDLEAFAGERWKKFLPVLQAADSDSDKSTPGGEREETPRRVPTGGAGGGKGRTYTVEDAEKRLEDSGQYQM